MSTIKTGTTLTTAYQVEGDTTGTLVIQTGSTPTTAATFDDSQNTTVAGNLTLSGTGKRITGDFSNATVANRVMFQSSTTNGATSLDVISNGTSQITGVTLYGTNAPTNTAYFGLANRSDAGDVRLTSGIAGTGTYLPMTFYTGGSESLRLSKDYKTVILSGGNTSANGTGITFPATQSASTDANTLDDYEEGTWTPAVNLLGTVTYGQQSGTYIKVGGLVTVMFNMYYSSTDTTQDGTALTISGLPFTATADSGTACLLTERMAGTNNASSPNTFHIQVLSGSSALRVYQNNYNGTLATQSYFVSQIRSCYKGANQYVYGSLSYRAA